MQLPSIQSSNREFQMLQNKWAAILNPLLANPVSDPLILKNLSLINGDTVINHKLGRTMQGWIISNIDAAATIYRSQPFNNLTLTLTSNAACVVDLVVF